jgi:hypothetical protein
MGLFFVLVMMAMAGWGIQRALPFNSIYHRHPCRVNMSMQILTSHAGMSRIGHRIMINPRATGHRMLPSRAERRKNPASQIM